MRHRRNGFHSFFQRSLTPSLSTETESCVVEIEQQHSPLKTAPRNHCVSFIGFPWIATRVHTLSSAYGIHLFRNPETKFPGITKTHLQNWKSNHLTLLLHASDLPPPSHLSLHYCSSFDLRSHPKEKTRSYQLLAILAKLKRENHTKPLTSKSRCLQTRGVT